METRFRTRSGEERDMLVAGEFIHDGKDDKMLFIGQDITRLKEVERLKSEFVSVVSHELRTPLTSIKGSLGLVLKESGGELSEQSRHLLQLAERNTDRLASLVYDILDFEMRRALARSSPTFSRTRQNSPAPGTPWRFRYLKRLAAAASRSPIAARASSPANAKPYSSASRKQINRTRGPKWAPASASVSPN